MRGTSCSFTRDQGHRWSNGWALLSICPGPNIYPDNDVSFTDKSWLIHSHCLLHGPTLSSQAEPTAWRQSSGNSSQPYLLNNTVALPTGHMPTTQPRCFTSTLPLDRPLSILLWSKNIFLKNSSELHYWGTWKLFKPLDTWTKDVICILTEQAMI